MMKQWFIVRECHVRLVDERTERTGMEFRRNARIGAPLSVVWALVDDIPTVASCIPGVHDLHMQGDREFDCVVSQRVGSVKSNFDLHAAIDDLDPHKRLTLSCEGKDRTLGSTVKARLQFGLADQGRGDRGRHPGRLPGDRPNRHLRAPDHLGQGRAGGDGGPSQRGRAARRAAHRIRLSPSDTEATGPTGGAR
jgi:carbon monoxide dehydrogenase subunit G